MSLRSWLYKLARLLGDWQAWTCGDPGRIARRMANKWIGRRIGRIWR